MRTAARHGGGLQFPTTPDHRSAVSSRPLWHAGVGAAMLGPLPLTATWSIYVDTMAAQHLRILLGIVARLIAKHGPVRIVCLPAGIIGVTVYHHATRIGVAQR